MIWKFKSCTDCFLAQLQGNVRKCWYEIIRQCREVDGMHVLAETSRELEDYLCSHKEISIESDIKWKGGKYEDLSPELQEILKPPQDKDKLGSDQCKDCEQEVCTERYGCPQDSIIKHRKRST